MSKPPWGFRLLGVLVLGIVVGSLAGAAWVLKLGQGGSPPPPAAPAPETEVACTGYVDVESGVAGLAPLGMGRVVEVPVHEGDSVKAGTVLLKLDDQAARLQVEEAQADLKAAEEQLAQAEKLPEQHQVRLTQQRSAVTAAGHRLEAARQTLQRQQDLERLQQVAASEVAAAAARVRELEALEQAERSQLRDLELDDPQSGLQQTRAKVAGCRARLKAAEHSVAECVLRAPSAGTVLRLLVSPGDVIGGQPRQPAVQFCPDERRLIRAEVPQEFARRVAVGQTISAQDDTSQDPATWKGHVLRISDWFSQRRSVLQEPLEKNDVRTLECLLALDPGQPPLRIGQRLRVTIQIGTRDP